MYPFLSATGWIKCVNAHKTLEQGLANRKHRWRDLPGTDLGASHAGSGGRKLAQADGGRSGGRKRAQADGGICGVLGPFVQCLSIYGPSPGSDGTLQAGVRAACAGVEAALGTRSQSLHSTASPWDLLHVPLRAFVSSQAKGAVMPTCWAVGRMK